MPLRLIISLNAAPGKGAEFAEAFAGRCRKVMTEPGCLQFDVVQDPKNATRFVMLEVYKDDAAIAAHQDSQHFKDFRPVVGDLIAERKVEVFHMVSDGTSKRA